MADETLQTKLYIPVTRGGLVSRPRLLDRLNRGLDGRLTLISAPAGFGKTTLVSEWVTSGGRAAAWLSLDEEDGEPARFLTYLIAALQRIDPQIGQTVLAILQPAQPPPVQAVLTALINEIAALPQPFTLVLDDYHALDAPAIDEALAFLLDHRPPPMHLVITTREDPNLPLARLRARRQLTELRANDLRFTAAETAEFLQQVMGLELAEEDIAALEARTEGWIAGLQLAALSMQGHPDDDAASFIQSFSGSHRFVLDYLMEEVLQQQPERIQTFLLYTSILDRLCGSLCEAVMVYPAQQGQDTLAYLEQANLFLTPLDNERRWYRYHHLFVELLRQRLQQVGEEVIAELHTRASAWYEANGQPMEAFRHAAAARDIDRAAHLIEGEGMPLQFRGLVNPVLNWLESLPASELNARPSLLVTYASALTMTGQLIDSVEEILQTAEAALQDGELDVKTRDLLGHIAAIRAMLAVPNNQFETMIEQSRHALELLDPDNLPVRTTTTWTLGYAYQVQGERAEAMQAYREAIAASQASGNSMVTIAATTCLGQVQESENQLYQAVETYRRVLELTGDPPWPAACEAYLGLARILYQWNDLDTAAEYGQESVQLAAQLANIDTPVAGGVFLARLKLAQGDATGAMMSLAEAEQIARRQHFDHWLEGIAAVRVEALLQQGSLTAAAQLARTRDLPLSQARVLLAQGNPAAALALLEPVRVEVEARGWVDKKLQVMTLQALAQNDLGEKGKAIQIVDEALALAALGGSTRLFLDEGPAMATLLEEAVQHGVASTFVYQVQAAFGEGEEETVAAQPLADPLTDRELEVLRLLGTDLTGPEIARELMISLNTMRTHTKNVYSKLGVSSRRAAVRRAKELDLL